MKQLWQPCYPGNDEFVARMAVETGCGHVHTAAVREGWYGDYGGDGRGHGLNGQVARGGGWGNGFRGWEDGRGDCAQDYRDGVLLGPDMMDTLATAQQFESATGSVTRVTKCSAAIAVGETTGE